MHTETSYIYLYFIYRDIARLESLQELNVSGNVLRSLPASLGRHSKLQCLRANTNLLRELPDFKNSPNLKVYVCLSTWLTAVPYN